MRTRWPVTIYARYFSVGWVSQFVVRLRKVRLCQECIPCKLFHSESLGMENINVYDQPYKSPSPRASIISNTRSRPERGAVGPLIPLNIYSSKLIIPYAA